MTYCEMTDPETGYTGVLEMTEEGGTFTVKGFKPVDIAVLVPRYKSLPSPRAIAFAALCNFKPQEGDEVGML